MQVQVATFQARRDANRDPQRLFEDGLWFLVGVNGREFDVQAAADVFGMASERGDPDAEWALKVLEEVEVDDEDEDETRSDVRCAFEKFPDDGRAQFVVSMMCGPTSLDDYPYRDSDQFKAMQKAGELEFRFAFGYLGQWTMGCDPDEELYEAAHEFWATGASLMDPLWYWRYETQKETYPELAEYELEGAVGEEWVDAFADLGLMQVTKKKDSRGMILLGRAAEWSSHHAATFSSVVDRVVVPSTDRELRYRTGAAMT